MHFDWMTVWTCWALLGLVQVQCSSSPTANCTFDTGLCGYTNGSAGSLLWASSGGQYIRGIEKDHTTGQGNFLYLTTNTVGSMSGVKSGVLTPPLTFEGLACVSFYYWIVGNRYTNLWAWLVSGDSRQDISVHTEILSVWGKDMTRWQHADVTAYVTTNDTIVFVSAKTGFFDYVAIDDVTVIPGNCTKGSKANEKQTDDPVQATSPPDTGQRTYRATVPSSTRGSKANEKQTDDPVQATSPPDTGQRTYRATVPSTSSLEATTLKPKGHREVVSGESSSPLTSSLTSSPSLTSSAVVTIVVVIVVGAVVVVTTVLSNVLLWRRLRSAGRSPMQLETVSLELDPRVPSQ